MVTLAGFPMLNQLADTSEVNRQLDCVPTCVAACLEYLLKRPFDGGAIKDAVYGASYQGGTSASEYVAYAKVQGVTMTPLDGDPAQLVKDIRFWLGQEQPLIATEPDPYVNASLGWTHVIAFYGYDTGVLTCLDPYGGHPVTLSDAEWTARLLNKQVWKFQKEEVMGIPAGWHDDGTTLYCPSHVQGGADVHVTGAFRDYVLANAWRPSDRFIEPAHHEAVMQYNDPALGSGLVQTSLWSMLLLPDSGAQAGKVIYAWLGVEEAYLRQHYAAQLAEINTLQTQLHEAQAALASSPDKNAVATRLTALAQLGHQIEALATQVL